MVSPMDPMTPPTVYDPFRGMDRDGRIPKVQLPEDVPRPERWRYVPEGRIKPGNALERFWVTSFVSPIVYFEQDVGLGGGVSITDIDFREQRRREFAGVFLSQTTEGQERYSVVWQRWLNHRDLPGGGVISEERSWIRAVAAYDRSLTERFYGIGADTGKGDETSYTDEKSFAQITLQASVPHVGDDVVLHLGLRGEHDNLFRGRVSSKPTTDTVYPALFAASDDHDSVWVMAALGYDRRDSQRNPYRGWVVEAGVEAAPWQEGTSGHEQGAIWNARASWMLPVPGLLHSGGDAFEENPPTDVLAIGGFVAATTGDLPFWDLPSLGGRDTLRGYIGHRFTDRAAWHASAEYRLWVVPRGFAISDSVRIERLGIAPFYDIGSVAHNVHDLGSATIHDTIGIGLRAMLERTALFRFDIGRSADGIGFNIAFGLSY